MAAAHHIVHLVMRLSAKVVKIRMYSVVSPRHRIVSGNRESRSTGQRQAPRVGHRSGSPAGPGADGAEASPAALHLFLPSRNRCNPVMR
jgi:hypothetical protein